MDRKATPVKYEQSPLDQDDTVKKVEIEADLQRQKELRRMDRRVTKDHVDPVRVYQKHILHFASYALGSG